MGRIEQKWIVALVGVFSIFMELLDTTAVNVAIPTLAEEFGVRNASTIQWIITGYLLSLAVFIPISGWAADRFGAKRVFMFALTTFSVASLLCALSWSIESLVAFRVLQGVGGGMLSPVAFAMVWREFPPEERSKAAGIMVMPAAVAPASGPVVGGLLVEYASWHWIFLINVRSAQRRWSSRRCICASTARRTPAVSIPRDSCSPVRVLPPFCSRCRRRASAASAITA